MQRRASALPPHLPLYPRSQVKTQQLFFVALLPPAAPNFSSRRAFPQAVMSRGMVANAVALQGHACACLLPLLVFRIVVLSSSAVGQHQVYICHAVVGANQIDHRLIHLVRAPPPPPLSVCAFSALLQMKMLRKRTKILERFVADRTDTQAPRARPNDREDIRCLAGRVHAGTGEVDRNCRVNASQRKE
eukprot:759388-Hanusia_phi.AAC.1